MRLGIILIFAFGGLQLQAQPAASAEDRGRDFDFWIGTWKVYAGDQLAGINRITPILNGGVLQENWSGNNGNSGTSLNYFNPNLKKWQQNWVWANGVSVTYTGEREGNSMVMSAKRKNAKGEPYLQRITWTLNEDGTVRQHSEGSKDRGRTWKTLYDLLYRREAE